MLGEIRTGCVAALALARGNTGPVSALTDFWRSFRAAAVAFPLSLLMLALVPHGFEMTGKLIAADIFGYICTWTAFPLIMVYVADRMQVFPHFWRFVIATNWANLLQSAVFTLVVLVNAAEFLPEPVSAMLFMAAWFWILLFKWRLARHGLGLAHFPAVAIVLLDLALRLVIARATIWFGS